ncbi:hypothetical protein HDF16_003266 [Granulicella aggregans]|uniref:Uncharacterized protein n=1 Tax=Granulicella aggregans TaxID=474949 RepID=A0A7W7ZEY3_9BACT|nr:hypothetical protein [Granulicella aggregans]
MILSYINPVILSEVRCALAANAVEGPALHSLPPTLAPPPQSPKANHPFEPVILSAAKDPGTAHITHTVRPFPPRNPRSFLTHTLQE